MSILIPPKRAPVHFSGLYRLIALQLAVVLLVGLILAGGWWIVQRGLGSTATLLVTASGRTAQTVAISGIGIHGSHGWIDLKPQFSGLIPPAPASATVTQVNIASGPYDGLRIGTTTVDVRFAVPSSGLLPLLVDFEAGSVQPTGIYIGAADVSVGLNELSGQLRAMPTFSLLDQDGARFNNSLIAGHTVVLAAFHTQCRQTCPLYTGLFLQLQQELPPGTVLVEATTDPAVDTPPTLKSYADSIGARWELVTGSASDLQTFWEPLDVPLSTGDAHASTLAVIDPHGYILDTFQGAPDLNGSLPPSLESTLGAEGYRELQTHGSGWGPSQILDSLRRVEELGSRSQAGGEVAPIVTLKDLAGKSITIQGDPGRPLLINFWASYCLPCRTELPLLQATAVSHPDLSLILIDERDSPAAARLFLSQQKVGLRSASDQDGKVGALFAVSVLPLTVFVWPDGVVESRSLGQLDPGALAEQLATLRA